MYKMLRSVYERYWLLTNRAGRSNWSRPGSPEIGPEDARSILTASVFHHSIAAFQHLVQSTETLRHAQVHDWLAKSNKVAYLRYIRLTDCWHFCKL